MATCLQQSDIKTAPTATTAGMSGRVAGMLLLLILGVGAAWRCYGITSRSLWFDEAYTYFFSDFPLAKMTREMRYDGHPPLYYLFLKGWVLVLGNSPLALRLPSLLCGLLAIAGIYFFTVEAQRPESAADGVRPPPTARARELGLWAAALVALSVFQIRWSWEVRMYALGAALTAFSSWALVRALHARSGRYGYWLVYVGLALVFIYTHYFALFTIAAQGLFVVGYLAVQAYRQTRPPAFLGRFIRHPQFLPALMAAALLCLGWLPWLPTFLYQRTHKSGNWVPHPSWAAARDYGFHLLIDPEGYVSEQAETIAVECAVFCGVIPLALVWRARTTDWFVSLGALVPIGISLAAAVVLGMRVFYSRYFLFAHLFLLVAIALLLGRIRPSWARVAIGTLVVLLMIGVDVRYLRELDVPHIPSFRAVAEYIEDERHPDEPVIVCDLMYFHPLRYHAGDAPGWYMFADGPNPKEDARKAMGAEHVIRREGLEEITGGRVWVVNTTGEDGFVNKVPVPKRWRFKGEKRIADRYGTGNRQLEVIEYEVPPAGDTSSAGSASGYD